MGESLHRARGADWEKQPASQWNISQKIAARTRGYVTLANFISICGASLVLYGLYLVTQRHISLAICFIFLGRMADLLDGMAAEYTKTKSSIGEALDATLDKVVIFITLIVVINNHLVPIYVYVPILLQSTYNSILVAIARDRMVKIHPSLAGKWAAAFAWGALIACTLGTQTTDHAWRLTLFAITAISFVVFAVAGLLSSYQYSAEVHRGRSS